MNSKRWASGLAVLMSFAIVAAACGSDSDGETSEGAAASGDCATAGKSISVLLPDTESSDRWETQDKPGFEAAFEEAGVDATVVNAEGDAQQQQAQAEQAIAEDAGVIVMTNLDSGSGAAIQDLAREAGVKVVDYDRETIEGDGADVYVSFGNVKVGEAMAGVLEPLIDDLGVETPQVVMLNGGPTDDNARLFREGYAATVEARADAGDWAIVADEPVPDWDNAEAGVVMEQILTSANNEVDAVFAANDGLAGSAITAMQAAGLDTTTIPVSGQDATVPGIQLILSGDQSMTVYKPIADEVASASEAALALLNCEDIGAVATDLAPFAENEGREIPAVLLEPIAVTADNLDETVFADGFVSEDDVCVGDFAQYC
ncbi:MAG TPA: substrate-binding domain-containing protein [Acidimicrobiales bacterium]|nr:substrate-binding domain-containing protein [Acidimicrobiales bacterium]